MLWLGGWLGVCLSHAGIVSKWLNLSTPCKMTIGFLSVFLSCCKCSSLFADELLVFVVID